LKQVDLATWGYLAQQTLSVVFEIYLFLKKISKNLAVVNKRKLWKIFIQILFYKENRKASLKVGITIP
jgi:O-antigen/teichoic acid export membrane protein